MLSRQLSLALACLCLAVPVAAQTTGFRNSGLPNNTGSGSATINSLVYYPSTSPGAGTPVLPKPGGHPVVVFLHGLGRIGNDYTLLGEALAQSGFVVVLHNTARTQAALQRTDAIALYPVLQELNATAGHFLEGALDLDRVGLAGHSVGGGNVLNVLPLQPGYDAGLLLAPQARGAAIAEQVTVPVGILHGTGDNVLAWNTNGLANFNRATNFSGLKFLYVFGLACDHDNLAGLGSSAVDAEIWSRSASVLTGFFRHTLLDETAALSEVVGESARAEPRLNQLRLRVEQPEMWAVGSPVPGQDLRVELIAELGNAGVMTAATTGSLVTRFGLLELDPTTLFTPWRGVVGTSRLFTWTDRLPAGTPVGTEIPLQGFGKSNDGRQRLTKPTTLVVQ